MGYQYRIKSKSASKIGYTKEQLVDKDSLSTSNLTNNTYLSDSDCEQLVEDYKDSHSLKTPSEAGVTDTYFWVEDLKNWCTYKKISSDALTMVLNKKRDHISENDIFDLIQGINEIAIGSDIIAAPSIASAISISYKSAIAIFNANECTDLSSLFSSVFYSIPMATIREVIKTIGVINTVENVANFCTSMIKSGCSKIYNSFCSDSTKHGEQDDMLKGTFGLFTWNGIDGWNPLWEYVEFGNTIRTLDFPTDRLEEYKKTDPVYFYPPSILMQRWLEHNFSADLNLKVDSSEIRCASISDGIILSHNIKYAFMTDDFTPIRKYSVDRHSGQYTAYNGIRLQYCIGAEPIVRLGSGELMLGMLTLQTTEKSKYTLNSQIDNSDSETNDICVKSFGDGNDKTIDDWMNFWPTLAEPTYSTVLATEGLISTKAELTTITNKITPASITFDVKKPIINIEQEDTPVLRKW